MKALAAMTRNVVCITPQDSLVDAYEIMSEWEIRHLPVLEQKRVVGILSDRDVLARSTLEETERRLVVPRIPVAEAMTHQPMTCTVSTDIAAIGETFLEHKIDSLPVIDEDNQLVGLITSSDLIELLIERERMTGVRALPFKFKVYEGAKPGMAKAASY